MAQYAVRVFARLGDGSLRQAKRYARSPKWSWEWSGIGAEQYNGDIIINVPTEADLPSYFDDLTVTLKGT